MVRYTSKIFQQLLLVYLAILSSGASSAFETLSNIYDEAPY